MKRPPLHVPTAGLSAQATDFPSVFTQGPQDMADDTRVTHSRRDSRSPSPSSAWTLPSSRREILAAERRARAPPSDRVRADAGVRWSACWRSDAEVVTVPDAPRGPARSPRSTPTPTCATPRRTSRVHAATDERVAVQWALESNSQWYATRQRRRHRRPEGVGELTDGAAVTVAVVDTGVDVAQPDLAGRHRAPAGRTSHIPGCRRHAHRPATTEPRSPASSPRRAATA